MLKNDEIRGEIVHGMRRKIGTPNEYSRFQRRRKAFFYRLKIRLSVS